MANMNLVSRQEGDTFDADSIKLPFAGLAAGVNALEYEAIEREALRADVHLTTLLPASAFATDLTRTGYHAAQQYNNYLPASEPPDFYQTFGTEAPVAGYGSGAPYGRPGLADDGWRIVNGLTTAPTNSAPAEVRLASASTLAAANLTGVLLSGSLQVLTSANAGPAAETNIYASDLCLLVAIGFEDSGGSRYIVERTIRWYSLNAVEYGSAETSTLIQQADLDALAGANTQVAAFFFVVASRKRALAGETFSYRTNIGQYHFSAVPIRAGALIP